jgi:hypothetical protein
MPSFGSSMCPCSDCSARCMSKCETF